MICFRIQSAISNSSGSSMNLINEDRHPPWRPLGPWMAYLLAFAGGKPKLPNNWAFSFLNTSRDLLSFRIVTGECETSAPLCCGRIISALGQQIKFWDKTNTTKFFQASNLHAFLYERATE